MNFDIQAFDFEICKEIQEQIKFIDQLLQNIGEPPIAENVCFEPAFDAAGTDYIRFRINNKSTKCIPLFIHFMVDGFYVDIFHRSEASEWSNDDLRQNQDEIGSFLLSFMTSYIVMETSDWLISGQRMVLFDKEGNFIRNYILDGFARLSFWRNCKNELFFPIFPNSAKSA